jgi:hypothetical protein
MKQEDLDKIIETVEGYPVKALRWLKRDNIIVGLVKCPFVGKANINEGFISCAWRKNGFTTNKMKGREDLNIQINLVD